MKTQLTTIGTMLLALGIAPGLAQAAVGESFDTPGVEILDEGGGCEVRGGLCWSSGARSTVSAASVPAAALSEHAAAGNDTSFARTLPASAQMDVDDIPWTLKFDAQLRQRALNGNTLFLIYDTENPKALASREVTAMWQAPVRAGNTVSAKLTLSPDDGFHANHTYLVRVVQLIKGKEVELAEGKVRLQ